MLRQNEPKQISEKNIIRPNKLLGQIFLRDKNVLNKIIAAANLTAGDRVLEVGPGLGVLTKELAKHAGQVIAVEKDKNLAEQLKEKFKNSKNVEIVEGDILSFLRKQESRAWIPGQARDDNPLPLTNYKVVANIPYYLTSRLIRLLLESDNPPADIILMIQKQVAQRICASPRQVLPRKTWRGKPPRLRSASRNFGGQAKMSLLAVSVQFYAEAKIIALVAKKSFWPQPKVDSAIIRITPKIPTPLQKGGAENFFRVVKAGFAQPRKQLINNLSRGLKLKREKIADILQTAGLKPQQRAETLNVEDWIKISNFLIK